MENQMTEAPKNYLVHSILATIFCCLPLGIVAIINANKVNTLYAAGDVDGAVRASEDTQKYLKYAVIAGAVYIVVVIILSVIGAF